MMLLRASVFNLVFFYLWSLLVLVGCLPLLASRKGAVAAGKLWALGLAGGLKAVVGLDWERRGLENLPDGPCIVAVKHHSAWETIIGHVLTPDPAIVMKRSILYIPVYALYCWRIGMIPVDRGGHAAALRRLIRRAQRVIAQRRQVLIFPEGTRKAVGAPPDYQAGIAALYSQLHVPVVPVALNSGVFWGRNAWVKRPGTITVEFLPPIPPGLKRKDFMARLEAELEAGTARLVAEASPPAAAG